MTSFNFFFQGTLRVLLVLLHDFPEFLCDYHYGFCDVIPPNCVQMRNLILSAFPRNMRLPDPFTPNLKVDMLTDISLPPRILINFASKIQPAQFKKVTYLSSFLSHQAVYKHFVMQGKIFLFKLGVVKKFNFMYVVFNFTGFGFILEIEVSRNICIRLEKLLAGKSCKRNVQRCYRLIVDVVFWVWMITFVVFDYSPVSQGPGTTFSWWMPWSCTWGHRQYSSSIARV